jgi:ESCRT-II complex subunit VPS22
MPDLLSRVERMRGIKSDSSDSTLIARTGSTGIGGKAKDAQEGRITPADIIASLHLLKPLGAGYTVLEMGGITYIRSVPKELDTDQSMLLVLASDTGGRLYPADVADKTGWSLLRANTALEDAVMREGIAWVDEQEEGVVSMGGRVVWIMPAVDFGES